MVVSWCCTRFISNTLVCIVDGIFWTAAGVWCFVLCGVVAPNLRRWIFFPCLRLTRFRKKPRTRPSCPVGWLLLAVGRLRTCPKCCRMPGPTCYAPVWRRDCYFGKQASSFTPLYLAGFLARTRVRSATSRKFRGPGWFFRFRNCRWCSFRSRSAKRGFLLKPPPLFV